MAFKKVRHDRRLKLEHEGERWEVDAAEWRDGDRGELRVYSVHGNINSPALKEALELEAASRGLSIKEEA